MAESTAERPAGRLGAGARGVTWSVSAWLPWLLVVVVLAAAVPAILGMPPIDRDESRFAQASKQMLETGDYVVINFQDEPRNKKPVGIHWLQALSVSLFSSAEASEIWAYRLPSLLGIVGAVLVFLALGRRLFQPEIAAIAALLLASCMAVQIEALMAKTDGVLLLTLVATQLGLVEVWRRSKEGEGRDARAPLAWRLLFWLALAAGVMIKGPIVPLVVGLTVLALCFMERRWRWLAGLSPLWGVPLLLALVLPWFVVVTFFRDTGFIGEAASKDLFAKLLGGEESHGLPPGFYIIAHLLFFWPGALFALPAVFAAWHRRREQPALLYALCWLLPTWVLFELVPTKLPHYVLPTYPALALITAWAVVTAVPALRRRWVFALQGFIGIGAVGLAAGCVALPLVLDQGFLWQSVPAALIVLFGVGGTLWLTWQGRQRSAIFWGAVGGVLFFAWVAGALMPRMERVFPSALLVEKWRALDPDGQPPTASSSFHEPSLVFLGGTETLLAPPEGVADYLAENPDAVVMISQRMLPRFLTETTRLGLVPWPLARLRVFNYSNGIWELVTYYTESRWTKGRR